MAAAVSAAAALTSLAPAGKLATAAIGTPVPSRQRRATSMKRGQMHTAATRPADVDASAVSAITDASVSVGFRLVRSMSPRRRRARSDSVRCVAIRRAISVRVLPRQTSKVSHNGTPIKLPHIALAWRPTPEFGMSSQVVSERAFLGNALHTPRRGDLELLRDALIVVDSSGRIASVHAEPSAARDRLVQRLTADHALV